MWAAIKVRNGNALVPCNEKKIEGLCIKKKKKRKEKKKTQKNVACPQQLLNMSLNITWGDMWGVAGIPL